MGRLEDRGLIERNADPDDGRIRVVSITALGHHTLAAKQNSQTERLAKTLASGFDSTELKQLAAVVPLLERLTEQF